MLRVIVATIIFAAAAQADGISITTLMEVNEDFGPSGNPECPGASVAGSGPVSFGNSCGGGQIFVASASTVPIFQSLPGSPLLETLSESGFFGVFPYTGPGAGENYGSATVDITETQTLDITGGTGQGVLSLEFYVDGSSENDYVGGSGLQPSFTVNGVRQKINKLGLLSNIVTSSVKSGESPRSLLHTCAPHKFDP